MSFTPLTSRRGISGGLIRFPVMRSTMFTSGTSTIPLRLYGHPTAHLFYTVHRKILAERFEWFITGSNTLTSITATIDVVRIGVSDGKVSNSTMHWPYGNMPYHKLTWSSPSGPQVNMNLRDGMTLDGYMNRGFEAGIPPMIFYPGDRFNVSVSAGSMSNSPHRWVGQLIGRDADGADYGYPFENRGRG